MGLREVDLFVIGAGSGGVRAARIAAQGGAGLFIDYGHLQPGIGDTLQALRRHRHEDVLAGPGEAGGGARAGSWKGCGVWSG